MKFQTPRPQRTRETSKLQVSQCLFVARSIASLMHCSLLLALGFGVRDLVLRKLPATVLPLPFPLTQSTIAALRLPPRNWIDQTQAEADAKSIGCLRMSPGRRADAQAAQNVVLGCTDCHGGNPARGLTKEQAHVLPRNTEFWKTSANPPNSNVWLNHESPEFIRFMNPGDLRVAEQTCGLCHGEIIHNVDHSMMNHGAMLWGAALYNNGGYLRKRITASARPTARTARRCGSINYTPVTPEDTQRARHSAVPRSAAALQPEQSRETSCASSKKAARNSCSLASRPATNRPGKPARRLSERGLGTLEPHRSGLSRSAKNATARSAARLSRLERSSGRLSLERLLGLPRRLRERSFAHEFRLVEQVRPPGSEFHRRQDDSEKRARPSDHAPVHALDSIEPVHELPHASGQSLRESVSRLHLVGPGNRRRIHVSQSSSIIRPTPNWSDRPRAIPKPPPRAGFGATRIFSRRSRS